MSGDILWQAGEKPSSMTMAFFSSLKGVATLVTRRVQIEATAESRALIEGKTSLIATI